MGCSSDAVVKECGGSLANVVVFWAFYFVVGGGEWVVVITRFSRDNVDDVGGKIGFAWMGGCVFFTRMLHVIVETREVVSFGGVVFIFYFGADAFFWIDYIKAAGRWEYLPARERAY